MLAITGFLPGNDPRMKATVDATAARLTDKRGLVYRYLARDGLAGEEGTFLLCTFWLAHAQALVNAAWAISQARKRTAVRDGQAKRERCGREDADTAGSAREVSTSLSLSA